MALTVEQAARLEQIRIKIRNGTSTKEEEIEGIRIIAGDRVSASAASTKARTAKAEASRPVDTQALLAGIKSKLSTVVMTKAATPAASTPPTLQGTFKL